MLEEENISALDEEEKVRTSDLNLRLCNPDQSSLTFLDAFTGKPLHDDIISFALPMVAPYMAVRSYKHKAKVINGTDKVGKGEV